MTRSRTLSAASRLTSRRLVIGSIVFGLFVILDLALFGWLIFDSLSQRELEKALLETRAELEPLARELESQAESLGQEDLWVVVSVTEETQTYVDSVLSERELVRKIQIRDRDGTVVFEQNNDEQLPIDGIELRPNPEMIELPIGEMGTLVVGLSEQEVARRIGDLRRDLTRQTSLIGAFSVTLLLAAFAVIWLLFRRAGRLEEQAREAERMAYVGTLASGLAHEIRNPLNALNLNMQMLEEEAREASGGAASQSQQRLVSITRSEIKRLEGLVTDFLSYAKPRPMDLQKTTAANLFEHLTEVLGGEIRALGADVEIDDRAPDVEVRVDRSQIGQLLLNLAKNALSSTEGTKRSPRLVLRARPEPEAGKATHLVLEVVDNGCGIKPEDQEKIFDLFYSTRKGGTGLGLAIAQRIAQSHDGALSVDSTPGEGTTISLRLPA